MRTFKAVTITIHQDFLVKFKGFCDQKKLPLSRFFSMAAMEKIEREDKQGAFQDAVSTNHSG